MPDYIYRNKDIITYYKCCVSHIKHIKTLSSLKNRKSFIGVEHLHSDLSRIR